jgi:hypothetical protein
MLMYPPALQAGFLLPAGDGALIEVEGGHDGLHRTAVSKQRNHREYQPLRLVYSVEGSTSALGEGPPATLAAITALLLAVDHDVTPCRYIPYLELQGLQGKYYGKILATTPPVGFGAAPN